ncbi:putative T7SS-secreted protein [Actinoplanes sp. NPDC048967]|uniref:putative T7SS-secreted protein n=1 Tax=Actinoplanes sp. NPDC048967 TaxID=3155269 RepID=UPI0033D5C02A
MAELGETDDPRALVPGDPGGVRADAGTLGRRAQNAERAGDGLIDIDTGAWEGKAGQAFRDKFSYEPSKWYDAANCLQTAADALSTYAATLEWAQGRAAEAIRMWHAAQTASQRARQAYDQVAAQATTAQAIAPFIDPGDAGRQAAHDALSGARRQVAEPAGAAARVLNAEANAAPEESGWLDDVGDFFTDVGADVVNSLASVGNAMLHHPGEVAAAAAGIGLTMVSAGGDGLGLALDATGVGAVAGVPLNIVSTAGIVAGVSITTAAGASLLQHAATEDAVSPMRGSTPARSAPRKTDRIKEHLTEKDLDAARRELDGEVVARKPDGTPWDHVDEVRNAQRGLVNRIRQLKREVGDPHLSAAERADAQAELGEASRLLDHSEQYVPRINP